jgi:hypothetical protein
MTGSFPDGVAGNANGSSYTISGTPTETGTFSYSLTATVNGCSSTAVPGTITVNEVCNGFYSCSTWTFGSQTWSDQVVADPVNCTKTDSLHTSNYTATEYRVYDGRYYYTWNCAYNNRNDFCPNTWKMPTMQDLNTLIDYASPAMLVTAWGLDGVANQEWMPGIGTTGGIWSSTQYNASNAYSLQYWSGGTNVYGTNGNAISFGMLVRCVK